jgi:hypothetical protein
VLPWQAEAPAPQYAESPEEAKARVTNFLCVARRFPDDRAGGTGASRADQGVRPGVRPGACPRLKLENARLRSQLFLYPGEAREVLREPDEPLDLPPNQALILEIQPVNREGEPAEESALAWIAANAIDSEALPEDLDRRDHYLYGRSCGNEQS